MTRNCTRKLWALFEPAPTTSHDRRSAGLRPGILLKRQLESQGHTFVESGGFTEKLYGARSQDRKLNRPVASDKQHRLCCPRCGKPMTLRTARQGRRAGQSFWGCSGYPECQGTLPATSSDQSDMSNL